MFFNKIHKTKTVYQMEATECGACCLSMIMAYYGKHVALSDIREKTGVSRDGCKADRILAGARYYGFFAEGRKMSFSALKREKHLPCIIHWKFNHFVVYEGNKFGFSYINDPIEGRIKVNYIEFLQSFTGVVLLLKPNENFSKNRKSNLLFKSIFIALTNDIKATLAIFFSGFLLVLPNILIAMLSEHFVDSFIVNHEKSSLSIIISALLLSNIFLLLVSIVRDKTLIKFYTDTINKASKDLVSHMFKLPMVFFEQRYAGDLATRTDDLDSLCSFIVINSIQILNNIVISVVILIFLIKNFVYLTLIGILFLCVNSLILIYNSKIIEKKAYAYRLSTSKLQGVISSGLSIIQTLKSSGIEDKYTSRVLGFYTNVIYGRQKYILNNALISSLASIFEYLFQIILLFSGCILIINKEMTVGQFVAFNTLFKVFINPVKSILNYILEYNTNVVYNDRINDIMLQTEDDFFSKNVKSHHKLNGNISIENVTFGYNKFEKPIINNISLEIDKGDTVAIVGKTGSGKTTLIKLLSGLYNPWSGNIKFDGILNNNISKEGIINSISLVNQEISIFSGTLRDNIVMWHKEYTDDALNDILKKVLLYDEIPINNKLDYIIEENGTNLSGGQIQKIEIARAIIKKPTILIFDEGTSSLDVKTEKRIIENISKDKITSIIIAHRLATVKNANNILVLKDGSIIEKGNHNQLMSSNGYYSELVKNM